MKEVKISLGNFNIAQFKDSLEAEIRKMNLESEIMIIKNKHVFRGTEPNMITALVGLAGTALGAFITGIFNVMSGKKESFIDISGDGWHIKVPAETESNKIEQIISLAKAKGVNKIYIFISDKNNADNDQ